MCDSVEKWASEGTAPLSSSLLRPIGFRKISVPRGGRSGSRDVSGRFQVKTESASLSNPFAPALCLIQMAKDRKLQQAKGT